MSAFDMWDEMAEQERDLSQHEQGALLAQVAAVARVSPAEAVSGRQTPRVCLARRELVKRLRERGKSPAQIARAVGRDASTVRHILRDLARGDSDRQKPADAIAKGGAEP